LDNERFGLNNFNKNREDNQKDYIFCQHLMDKQGATKLVNRQVDSRYAMMHMIMEELGKAKVFGELVELGYHISIEQATHAIAEQIERNKIEKSMKEVKQKVKAEKKCCRHIHDFFDYVAEEC
jgi:hypothetical protein